MNPDFLKIDELKLMQECMGHATIYFQYAERLANARNALDEAKVDLDVTAAELSQAVRANPKKYGIDATKVTEKAIDVVVPLLPEHRDAQQTVLTAKHKAEVYQAAVTALEHRKRTLTLMVELERQGWNAEPRVSRAGREAVTAVEKDRIRRLGQRKEQEIRDEDNDED